MAKRYNKVVCPICSKHFDPRKEGFKLDGKLVCADCYFKTSRYKTAADWR